MRLYTCKSAIELAIYNLYNLHGYSFCIFTSYFIFVLRLIFLFSDLSIYIRKYISPKRVQVDAFDI